MLFPLIHRAGYCFAQTAFCPAIGCIKIYIIVHGSAHRASYVFFSHNITSQKHRINTISVQNQHQKAVIRGFDSIIYLLYGYSLVAFSELLYNYGVDVSDKGISKWEKGYTTPSIYQLVAICHALNIKEGPSYFTKALQKPALLNDIGQKKLPSTKWT